MGNARTNFFSLLTGTTDSANSLTPTPNRKFRLGQRCFLLCFQDKHLAGNNWTPDI